MERKMGLSSLRALSNASGIPVDGIVRMLEQIGTVLMGQAVGVHDGGFSDGSNSAPCGLKLLNIET